MRGAREGTADSVLGGGEHRRDLVREYVLERGSVALAELAERYGVSVMTVHRDLAVLERDGVVRRFRGGVAAQPSATFEGNVGYRSRAMRAEKDIIAGHARRFVEPGMSVLLDESTTCMALATKLGGISPLTVVTNQLGSLGFLARVPGIRLIGLGGEYDAKYDSFVGMACTVALESLSVDVVFVSAYGVAAGYAYHQDHHIVTGQRAMLACGGRKVLLVDHSKLGRVGLHKICSLSVFNTVIVDGDVSTSALSELQHFGVSYEVAAGDTEHRTGPGESLGNPPAVGG
jgi:DeoR/GlpR family transcriptional regulator of sugar metabolism